jgi:hypothetical protein
VSSALQTPTEHATPSFLPSDVQVNLVVLFEGGHLVTENFPIRLIRT